MSNSDEASFDASKAMLTAAVGGLLCFAACVSSEHDGSTSASSGASSTGEGGAKASSSATSGSTATSVSASVSTSGAGGQAATGTAGTGTAGTGTAATSTAATTGQGGAGGGGTTNPHTPIPDTKCASGVVPNPVITSSTMEVLTQAEFSALCTQADGIFEVQPLCGGSNACRGFTYDSGTEILIEHSCQATNACAGYSCVVCG